MKTEKGRRRKKRPHTLAGKFGVFLLVFCSVLVGAAALATGLYFFMQEKGKASFAAKQEAFPKQMQAEQETDAVLENDVADEMEEDWIRYGGKTYSYKNNILTFLCMGIDKKGEIKASENLFRGGQADALFLAVLDPDEKKVSVIGINRDTMTEISTFDKNGLYAGKEVAQIALAHAYGEGLEESCENTVDAVSNLFYGLPIHGYCAVNMSVINLLNDAVGGVDVVIPESAAGWGKGWKTGDRVHLEGREAFIFLQNRDIGQAQSAEARLERQKQYLHAFAGQAKEAMKQDMTLPMKLYTQIMPYMVTDITAEEAVYLAGQALSYCFGAEDIYTLQGHVEMGEKFEEFYQDDMALYEMILGIFYEEIP